MYELFAQFDTLQFKCKQLG